MPAEECETLATSASSSSQCIGASNAAPSPALLRAWRCFDVLLGLGCAVKAGVASAEQVETFAAGARSSCALHLQIKCWVGPAQGMGASNSAPSSAMLRAWRCLMCCLGLGCAVNVGVAPAEECECETLATSASFSAQCIGASNAAPSPAMLRAWRCYDALLGLGCAVKAGVASAEHFETFAAGARSSCALHLQSNAG